MTISEHPPDSGIGGNSTTASQSLQGFQVQPSVAGGSPNRLVPRDPTLRSTNSSSHWGRPVGLVTRGSNPTSKRRGVATSKKRRLWGGPEPNLPPPNPWFFLAFANLRNIIYSPGPGVNTHFRDKHLHLSRSNAPEHLHQLGVRHQGTIRRGTSRASPADTPRVRQRRRTTNGNENGDHGSLVGTFESGDMTLVKLKNNKLLSFDHVS